MKYCNRYVSDSVKYHSESTKLLFAARYNALSPSQWHLFGFHRTEKKKAERKMATPVEPNGVVNTVRTCVRPNTETAVHGCHTTYAPHSTHAHNDGHLTRLELTLLFCFIHSNRDGVRKAREVHLITRDNTLQLLGLNKQDEMQHLFLLYYFKLSSNKRKRQCFSKYWIRQ